MRVGEALVLLSVLGGVLVVLGRVRRVLLLAVGRVLAVLGVRGVLRVLAVLVVLREVLGVGRSVAGVGLGRVGQGNLAAVGRVVVVVVVGLVV